MTTKAFQDGSVVKPTPDTLYIYDFDNTKGDWRKLDHKVIQVFEIWAGSIPIDGCAQYCPPEWQAPGIQVVHGLSPDPRIC